MEAASDQMNTRIIHEIRNSAQNVDHPIDYPFRLSEVEHAEMVDG